MFPCFTLGLICCVLLSCSAAGQGQLNSVLGLFTAPTNDPWLVWQQPDQLGKQRGISGAAGSWYRWNTPDAGERMLAISAAVPGGGLAFGMQQQSFAGLRESQHVLGFGRDFIGWQLGLQLQHERQRIEERSRDRMGYGLSGSYPLHRNWMLLASFRQTALSDANWQRSRQLPVFQAGFSHQLSEQLQLCASSILQIGANPALQGGVYYQPVRQFSVVLGYESSLSRLAFGLNYQLKQLRTSLSAQYHPQLGTAYWIDLCLDLPSFSF